jgi:hypothetical protein
LNRRQLSTSDKNQKQTVATTLMNTKILTGLIIVLAASSIAIRAEDNPSQAAARAALAKRLFEFEPPQLRQPPGWDSGAMLATPAKATNANHQIKVVATNIQPPTIPIQPPTIPPAAIKPVPAPTNQVVSTAAPVAPIQIKNPAPAEIRPTVFTNPVVVTAKPPPTPAAPTNSARLPAAPNASPTPPPVQPASKRALVTPTPTIRPLKTQPANDLVTLTGALYKNAHVERVETNGLIISYVPARGGTAMTKVYFEDLSTEVRQQYKKQ